MAAGEITFANLRPFVAPVLFEAVARINGRALLLRLINDISEQVRRPGTRRRRIALTTEVDESDGLLLQAIVYRDAGSPSWLAGDQLEDVEHNLIVAAVRDRHATICASDGAMRDRLVKQLKSVRRMPRDAIAAFVGDEAKAIWLNGIHTPTSSKADTKAMTGIALEDAIDRIGDQTYYYSAARTVPKVPGLESADGRPVLVGAAPGSGRVWVRRADSWEDFKTLTGVILDHATSDARPADPFVGLAHTIENAADVTGAYGLSVVPEELLSEDDLPAAVREKARRWAFDVTYDVVALEGLSLRVTPKLAGVALGVAELIVTLEEGLASIALAWVEQRDGMEEACAACAEFLSDTDRVKIYYESGHTIAQGRCYEGGYIDQPFEWDFRSFAGYEINREKPVVPRGRTLASQIAVDGDKSLFAYVCEKMFLDRNGNPQGWLASDDGSMELADFIHIDPVTKVISLVHVKASDSTAADRSAAPADYEIVVSQAVKNLRHLDRRNLVQELERGKGKKIGAAVWHDGVKQADREGFLAAARKLPRAAAKSLIVLQPRVTKSEHQRCQAPGAAPSHVMRVRQIDTMLLAARASALACGATFAGIGDVA